MAAEDPVRLRTVPGGNGLDAKRDRGGKPEDRLFHGEPLGEEGYLDLGCVKDGSRSNRREKDPAMHLL